MTSFIMLWRRCRACSRSRGIWDWLWFSCGVAHCGRGLFSVFQKCFASISGIFNLAVGLGAELSFYGVFRHSPDVSQFPMVLNLK